MYIAIISSVNHYHQDVHLSFESKICVRVCMGFSSLPPSPSSQERTYINLHLGSFLNFFFLMHIFSILILKEYKKRDTAEAKFRIASAYK